MKTASRNINKEKKREELRKERIITLYTTTLPYF